MGCGYSKSDEVRSRVTSAQVQKEFPKQRNITKSASSISSSSSSSGDENKTKRIKEKKIKKKKDNAVIKANEDKILNNESHKPLTPIPKSADSRGSRTRKSSSSGFSEREKDASSIEPHEVERNVDYDNEEKRPPIFSVDGNDEEHEDATQKDTTPTYGIVTDIKEDGGEDNQKGSDLAMFQPEITADNKEDEDEDDEENTDGQSVNNENYNDTQQINKQNAEDEDLGIYEDSGNNNDIDDENDKTQGANAGADNFDDTEQQMNDDGEDMPDTFQEHTEDSDTEHNKGTEPSRDAVKESNEDYDSTEERDEILTPTPRSEIESKVEEDDLDVPDTM